MLTQEEEEEEAFFVRDSITNEVPPNAQEEGSLLVKNEGDPLNRRRRRGCLYS